MIEKFFMPSNHNMKKTYIWTVLAGSVYAGSSFLMSMFTSKYIGVAQAGILALALTIGNQLVTIGLYNIRTFQVSDVTEKYTFSDYCVLRVLTVSAMLLVGVIWVLKDSHQGVKLAAIGFAILFRAIEAVSDLLEGRYQQKGRYDVACKGVFVKVLSYLAAFLVTLFLTKNIAAALGALAVTYLIMLCVIDSRLIGRFGGISFQTTWMRQKGLLLEGLPLFVNAFLNAYIINASKYALDKYYDSETLGIFNVLYMMAFVVNMFASFVLKPIISVLAEKYVKRDISGFVKLVLRQVAVILTVTLVCIGGAWLLGVPVLGFLFGVDLTHYKGGTLCGINQRRLYGALSAFAVWNYHYAASVQYFCVLWAYRGADLCAYTDFDKAVCSHGGIGQLYNFYRIYVGYVSGIFCLSFAERQKENRGQRIRGTL